MEKYPKAIKGRNVLPVVGCPVVLLDAAVAGVVGRRRRKVRAEARLESGHLETKKNL